MSDDVCVFIGGWLFILICFEMLVIAMLARGMR
jgi:hypothetical protein